MYIHAAVAGGLLAPLLPVLAKSLAATRQQQRVQAELAEIRSLLEKNETAVVALTDQQYKLVNEAVLALLHTTEAAKMRYLRSVVRNALNVTIIDDREAIVLSRIVRDISAQEAGFLVRAFMHDGVQLIDAPPDQPVNGNILRVGPATQDALSVTGLLSLGVFAPAAPAWGASGPMPFTRIAAKLIALLRDADA